ncbi:MAG: signal peptidase I [Elusimicrobia bacterium]|nr:signal peptidase I [Elusimicrobiota bacterium]
MKRLVFIIAVGIVLALLFRHFCLEVVYIATPSMEPSIRVKDQVVVNKTAYLFNKPGRGDIIMFSSPVSDKDLVKRVVGLPGEIFHIEDKAVFINGNLLDENYAYCSRPDTMFVGDNIDPFTIPQDHYFVMGDNRSVSRDSRDWLEDEGMQMKTIPLRDIKGKVLLIK